jgi:hypothetical protein
MGKSLSKKFSTLNTIYLILISIFIIGLLCELYFVLERRWLGQRVVKYLKDNRGIYSVRLLAEANVSPLWEIPGKKYKAGAVLDKALGTQRYIIKINRYGFRTKEFQMQKPVDVYRIICIGASTTVQGNTNDDTYPAILEKKLNARYPGQKIEVLNFGISYTLSDYWLSDPEGLFKFQPDLIIQYNAVNDICWRYLSWRNNTCTNKGWYLLRRGLNLSFLLQKVFPLDVLMFDKCFMQTLQNFKKISAEARSRGVDYLVGSFAAPDYKLASKDFREYLDYIVQNVWGRALNLKYYASYYNLLSRYNELFHLYVRQNKLKAVFVDESISHPALFVDVCHMTPEGIEKLADAFYEGASRLISNKLGPIKGAKNPS